MFAGLQSIVISDFVQRTFEWGSGNGLGLLGRCRPGKIATQMNMLKRP